MAYSTRRTHLLTLLLAVQATACIIIDGGKTTDSDATTTADATSSSSSDSTTGTNSSTGTDSTAGTDSSAGTGTDSATTSSSGTTGASTSGTTIETTTATTGDTTGGADPGFDPNDPGVQTCADPFANDSVDIMSAAIKGDLLFLDIGYSGGCQTHDFGLCWDGAFAESDPVQASLVLAHDGHGDACEAYITEQKQLMLAPLKKAWQDAYQQQSGTIILNLAGWADPIPYIF